MLKPYQLVILDWEGTIGDSLGEVLHCLKREAERLHFGDLNEASARRFVGLGLTHALRKIFPHLNLNQHEQLMDAVQRALMSRHSEVFLFEGAKEFIENLYQHQINLAIATNKGQQSLQRALTVTGLREYISVTRTAEQTLPKPYPQMLEEILQEFALNAREALMIGDSEHDIIMAQSIGMDAIGVNFYNEENRSLLQAGALAVFDNYQSITNYLKPILESF